MGAPGALLALHLRVGGGHHIAEQLDRNDFDAFLVGLLKLAKNLVVDDALARPWSIRLEMTEQETLDMDLVVTVWRRRLLAAMPRIREDDRVTGLSLVDLLPKPRSLSLLASSLRRRTTSLTPASFNYCATSLASLTAPSRSFSVPMPI